MNVSLHAIFFTLVTVLAGLAISHFYLVTPVTILPAGSQATPAPNTDLPPNHPPMELAEELMALEERSRAEPDNPQHRTRIGNIYYDMGQHEKAIEAYRASLALSPENPSVETDLATSLHYTGQHDEALALLDKVLAYQPGFPQALFNKGIVLYEGKKDRQGALAVWETLLETNPTFSSRVALQEKIRQLAADRRRP